MLGGCGGQGGAQVLVRDVPAVRDRCGGDWEQGLRAGERERVAHGRVVVDRVQMKVDPQVIKPAWDVAKPAVATLRETAPRQSKAQCIPRLEQPVRRPRPGTSLGIVTEISPEAFLTDLLRGNELLGHSRECLDVPGGSVQPEAGAVEAEAVHADEQSDLGAVTFRRGDAVFVEPDMALACQIREVHWPAVCVDFWCRLPLAPPLIMHRGGTLDRLPGIDPGERIVAPCPSRQQALVLVVDLEDHAQTAGVTRDDHATDATTHLGAPPLH